MGKKFKCFICSSSHQNSTDYMPEYIMPKYPLFLPHPSTCCPPVWLASIRNWACSSSCCFRARGAVLSHRPFPHLPVPLKCGSALKLSPWSHRTMRSIEATKVNVKSQTSRSFSPRPLARMYWALVYLGAQKNVWSYQKQRLLYITLLFSEPLRKK